MSNRERARTKRAMSRKGSVESNDKKGEHYQVQMREREPKRIRQNKECNVKKRESRGHCKEKRE